MQPLGAPIGELGHEVLKRVPVLACLRQVIMMFQKQDGVDVCLYCLYMQARAPRTLHAPAVDARGMLLLPQPCSLGTDGSARHPSGNHTDFSG